MARAPRTFGFSGAADHVTMNLHGIDDGRSVEDVRLVPVILLRRASRDLAYVLKHSAGISIAT